MNTMPRGSYPDAYYRVSLKAIIRNAKGEVLFVKENGSDWTLPGGGIDHGESEEEALKRELYEEALIDEPFRCTPIGIDHMFVPQRDAFLLWVVYEVTFEGGEPTYSIGVDGDAAEFIDPRKFKDSTVRAQQLAYRWCVDRTASVKRW